MTFDKILTHLKGVTGSGGQRYARCPAHDDNCQSLSIAKGDKGGVVLHCHAGCDTKDILKAAGLKMADLAPPKLKYKTVCYYDYLDADGNLLAQKLRQENGEAKKFIWRQPETPNDYTPSKWIYHRKGLTIPLYNVDALCKVGELDTVFIVEGEKDVDTLAGHKIVAVCGADGAGPGKWFPHYTEALKGKSVVVIPDNDTTGRAFAIETANALHSVAKSVVMLNLLDAWPTLQEHGDISDIFEMVGDDEAVIDALNELMDSATDYTPQPVPVYKSSTEGIPLVGPEMVIQSAADLMKKVLPPLRWIVEGLLPQGLSLLVSPPKYGKSWMVLDLCISVARGLSFLNHPTVKSRCLYLALEDSDRRLKDRLQKVLGGKPAPPNFDLTFLAPTTDTGLLDWLEQYIIAHPDTGLIAIDTLQKIRGAMGSRDNQYAVDYREISAIKALGDKHNIAILLVHHLRKGKDDEDVFNRISGTNGILGSADTAMVLTKDKREADTATLSVTGRDVDSTDTVLSFNKETFRWKVVGSLEEIEERRLAEEYDNDPIVQTIRNQVNKSKYGWSCTMQKLIDTCGEFTGEYPTDDARTLGRKMAPKARMLWLRDEIKWTPPGKNGGAGGRKHHFQKVNH